MPLQFQITSVMEDLQKIGMAYRKQRLLRGDITNLPGDPLRQCIMEQGLFTT
jgi:hypothetical protein